MLQEFKAYCFRNPILDRRSTPAVGPSPRVGSYIAKKEVAIKVIGKLTTDQWHWFLSMGWREVDVKQNRRLYYRLPKDTLHLILAASTKDREKVYRSIMRPFS